MIVDYEKMMNDYAMAYADKSRIFFIEKYLSTYNASAGRMTPFILFPRQKVFLKSIAENPASIAIKHRQCGITTISSAWICGQIVFATKESPEVVLCIGNKLDLANQLVEKIRDFLEQVPRWYWGEDYWSPDPSSEKNKKDIFIKNSKSELHLFNGCKVYARSSGENAARGISAISTLLLDEAAFIENGLAVYTSAVAASASNPNRKIILVSTPNGKDALYYDIYRKALAKENNFNPVEFKWFQDLRYNKHLKWYKKDEENGETKWIIEDVLDESGTVRYDEDRWAKLESEGWLPSSPWYEEMKKSFNNDPMKIAQELDVSFLGSANNVIAPEFIDIQSTLNVRKPLEELKDPMNDESWFWKPPIEGHRYICACDPSRGTSEDKTAIEIIDMDGIDDNGMPIVEQVMEYNGRKLGDEIGGMIYQYATMYNNAFVVADATGGQADALLLTLIQMGYKNLYYEDSSQKTYTVQNSTKNYDSYNDKLPGFHFQGNRYPVLSNFAGMVRNNEFKIRSTRVINELDTWIFKEGTGRIDHQSGSHDDTITCLAMGLFVMQYTVNRLQNTKNKDAAILSAYKLGNSYSTNNSRYNAYNNETSIDMKPKMTMPFYNRNTLHNRPNNINGNFMWIFGKIHN